MPRQNPQQQDHTVPSKALVVRWPGPRDEHASHQGGERPWDSGEFMEGHHDQLGSDGRPIVYGADPHGGVPPRVVVLVPPAVPNVPGCSEAYGVYYQTGGAGGGGGDGAQKPEYRDEGSGSRQRHKGQSAADRTRKESKSGGGSSDKDKEKKKKKKKDEKDSTMAALRFLAGETDVLGRRMGHSKRK